MIGWRQERPRPIRLLVSRRRRFSASRSLGPIGAGGLHRDVAAGAAAARGNERADFVRGAGTAAGLAAGRAGGRVLGEELGGEFVFAAPLFLFAAVAVFLFFLELEGEGEVVVFLLGALFRRGGRFGEVVRVGLGRVVVEDATFLATGPGLDGVLWSPSFVSDRFPPFVVIWVDIKKTSHRSPI